MSNSDAKQEGLWSMMGSCFRGPLWWTSILVWIYGVAFVAVAIFALLRLFAVDQVRYMIFYAALFVAAIVCLMAIKMWFWMQIYRNSILRQMERLQQS